MYTCKICNKEFDDRRKYAGHVSSHSRGIEYSLKRRNPNKDYSKNITHQCKFCNIAFESGQKLGHHITRCKLNPEFELIDLKRKLKLSIAAKNRSVETLEKISKSVSKTVSKKVSDGTWHFSFSKTRCHEYNGVRLYGMWEVKYAMYLDSNNVRWIQNKKRFPYMFDKQRHYIPDFYLLDEDCYVEIKGYETEKDRAKWKAFPFKLKVLKYEDLKALGIMI